MKQIILVLGGCRSGKSRHALALAEPYMAGDNRFVATCVAHDAEMQARVRQHQAERDGRWTTVETPTALADTVSRLGACADVMLVDCLTLWINNLMAADYTDEAVSGAVSALTEALDALASPVILVSNEVGTGIVPENAMARRYRDLAGFANQRVAASADRVVWMVAGIPVQIK
ncbi:MAG: bifunctional adenosylcobinamide kinase/adenosylcobinamide-phosphate guanylyltransferase [Thermodesulfobacteriota bacterium]